MADTVYPLSALRALALHVQGLDVPNGAEPAPAPDAILDIVKQIQCVQIDTLHMVHRAQYLTIWSRLGAYDPADFDRLIFDEGSREPGARQLFEHWRHAASIIPLAAYRWQMPHMQQFREDGGSWWRNWLKKKANRETVERVVQRIREEGPQKTSDFQDDGPKRGSWWDWKPAKHALEYLFARGDLMIADRVNFHRVYDLTERVRPDWVNVDPPTHDEYVRYHVEQGLRASGVGQERQIGDYAYMKITTVRPAIEALLAGGVAVPVEGEMADGSTGEVLVHRDHLPLLERAAAGDLPARRTTFLNPFDNLLWSRERLSMLWNFDYTVEMYTPKDKRVYGYYNLPILHGDRLIGRFDPKLERDSGLLRLNALHLEPGIEPTDDLVAGMVTAMRDFMAFHEATEIVIEKSNPKGFGKALLKAL